MEEKKKSWFETNWVIGLLFGLVILIFIWNIFPNGLFGGDNQEETIIHISSSLLVPQNSEVDREWKIGDITSIDANSTGFVEGSERHLSRVGGFLDANSIMTKTYRFDSLDNALQFYNKEKQKIDIRGVEEWSIETDCFGIKQDSFLSGAVTGLCLRNNLVFYIRSSSSSYDYAKEGKNFMKIMLNKV